MTAVLTQGDKVGISIDLETAEKLLALIGTTADGTFGELYDGLCDAGVTPMLYHTKTYGDQWVNIIYLEKA
jgi:hypothetical protein